MMKPVLSTLMILASAVVASAGETGLPNRSDRAGDLVVRVDWQLPEQLPPSFRNHCTVENFTGRPYCSNHCGADYQFYYCSPASFGCCHLGHGYCDWHGVLRCHP
jgi:hypothetical protein